MRAAQKAKAGKKQNGRRASISLADSAYETIKHKIIVMEFQPGEYLNESLVSDALEIGRTPVHQALTRLMLEGMIDIIPRKGAIVKNVSLNEITEIINVRLINETHVARLAATFADEHDIKELARILDEADKPSPHVDLVRQMLLDKEFHYTLSKAAKNTVLADILAGLHERSLRFWFISLKDPIHHKEVHDEHRKIYEAVAERDADKAAQAVREHIESFRKTISRNL